MLVGEKKCELSLSISQVRHVGRLGWPRPHLPAVIHSILLSLEGKADAWPRAKAAAVAKSGMTITDSLRPPPRRNQPRMLDFSIERDMAAAHGLPIAGIDEAGRGPWAGPVVAAAVILDPDRIPNGITDSKALNEEKRDLLFRKIMEKAQVGVGVAEVERIDRENILQATLWAMGEAVRNLSSSPKMALVDGNRLPQLSCPAQALVKGDARCLSIAAASIIAKVTRDRTMIALAKSYPDYGFERHKGYGTAEHRAALDKHGVTPIHRRSFGPVQLKLQML